MRRKAVMLLAVCVLPWLLGGCWDFRNIKDMNFISAIGIDYEDGQYVVYAQMVDFSSLSTSNGSPMPPTAVWIGVGQGPTLNGAFHELYNTSEKRIFWGHVTGIVFSETLVRKGIDSIIEVLNRYRELRYGLWLYSTKEKFPELLKLKPFFNQSPIDSVMHYPISNYMQASYIKPIDFQYFIRLYKDAGATVMIPRLSANQRQWLEDGKPKPMLEIDGITAIGPHKQSAGFSRAQTAGLRWLEESTIRSAITLKKGNRVRAMLVGGRPKPSITAKVGPSGEPVFDIAVQLEANLLELIEPMTVEEIEAAAAEAVASDIRRSYAEGLEKNIDMCNLEHELYRQHNKLWREREQQGGLQLTPQSLGAVNVKVALTHTGKYELMVD